MKAEKFVLAVAVAILSFVPQVQADDFNPNLVSQVYLRTGFGGAAEQVTGLRYGLRYDYSWSAGSLMAPEPLMRMEFLSGQLVGLNLGGVNVTPAIDMLRAAGFGALGNAGALFAAGGAAVVASVVKSNEDRAGFEDLTEEKGSELQDSIDKTPVGDCRKPALMPALATYERLALVPADIDIGGVDDIEPGPIPVCGGDVTPFTSGFMRQPTRAVVKANSALMYITAPVDPEMIESAR